MKLILVSLLLKLASCFAYACTDVSLVKEGLAEFEEYYCIDQLPVITSNTEVRFSSYNIILNLAIAIKNVSNISLIGYNETVITCDDNAMAGLKFINIRNLSISGIVIENCSLDSAIDTDPYLNIKSSMIIQNCTNVYINNITVMNGSGTGLALFDIAEYLNIVDSTFEANGHDKASGGNGIYLEVTEFSKSLGPPIVYDITGCKFINNTADTGKDMKIIGFSRFDKGGGLCIIIRSQKGVKITIEDALISNNIAAAYGGGIYATFHNNARDSVITVQGSVYMNNTARSGGGHYSGYLHNRQRFQTPLNCQHIFKFNNFTGNSAFYGGGVSVYSTKTNQSSTNVSVEFESCTWKYNRGQVGSSIAILPNAWNLHKVGYLPNFHFSDCEIESNYVNRWFQDERKTFRQYSRGYGALFCTDHTLEFSGTTVFNDNNGTALSMSSCLAHFAEHSTTTFSNNIGFYGGAVNLLSSILYLTVGSNMTFQNNTAYSKGGAIYQNSYKFQIYNYSKSCFLGKRGNKNSSITVQFIDNNAGNNVSKGYGHSMYITTLFPCHRINFDYSRSGLQQIFRYIGEFTFKPHERLSEIATDVRLSYVNQSTSQLQHIDILPGKAERLDFEDRDDFDQLTRVVYAVTIKNEPNSIVSVDSAYEYISSNEIKLYGNTNDEATIFLNALLSKQRALVFHVKMLPCPPGYVLTHSKIAKCECAFKKKYYVGIKYCDDTQWKAYRQRGYWIGYEINQTEDENSLLTGYCPIGFCKYNEFLLPSTADGEELNKIVCSESRTGILCGKCMPDHSVYYHSLYFKCIPNKHCRFGWLFYILSEIVPITVIFLAIIFFNITFTSGLVNGFIFYSQVVPMLQITAGGFIPFPVKLSKIILFLYLHFNLSPFVVDDLSFCLFKNATSLDTLSFSYITLIYSFLLIIGIILLMGKLNPRYYCKSLRKCTRTKRQTMQHSIIHALSAFLVLCYAKCARVSISLISFATVQGKGELHQRQVVYYNGEFNWFSTQHLRYAIPAIFVAILVTVIPPILLLIYPIHYKLLSALKISEFSCVRFVFRPLDQIKPLLDSFQGSFKDKFRFFSGLYFLYRLSILINVTLNSFKIMFFILSIQLLGFLVLHGVCQPYKKRSHNIIDTLLFINLAVINGFTLYSYTTVNSGTYSLSDITLISWIQSALVMLPLVIALFCVLYKVLPCKLAMCISKLKKKDSTASMYRELPSRLLYELDELQYSSIYMKVE